MKDPGAIRPIGVPVLFDPEQHLAHIPDHRNGTWITRLRLPPVQADDVCCEVHLIPFDLQKLTLADAGVVRNGRDQYQVSRQLRDEQVELIVREEALAGAGVLVRDREPRYHRLRYEGRRSMGTGSHGITKQRQFSILSGWLGSLLFPVRPVLEQ